MNQKRTNIIVEKLNRYKEYMFGAERYMWENPETGFNEWKAHNYLKERFSDLGFEVTQAGNIPGFYFDIDTGRKGPTVALLGELDALIIADHPESDPETGAVHACGHHCQAAALPGIAGVCADPEILSELCGRIRIMAVPAEELIELEKRSQMKKDGEIRYISGKSEFMSRGFFNGVDIAIMLHSADRNSPGINVRGGTSGIVAKRVVFHGSEHVSGAVPVNGVNALYAAQTAMNTINALRETFPHKSNVRIQSVITRGGETVQFMPSEVVIESNVRAYDYDVLKDVNEKANRAYTAAAVAFGAEVTIEDLEIFIPENNSNVSELANIACEVGCDLYGEENANIDLSRDDRSPGGTDMGNVGSVIPTIQPHLCFPGAFGHSIKFRVDDPEYAVLYHAAVLTAMTCVLLENSGERAQKVISEYKPIFSSIKEYCEEMDKVLKTKKSVKYNEEGANLQWI